MNDVDGDESGLDGGGLRCSTPGGGDGVRMLADRGMRKFGLLRVNDCKKKNGEEGLTVDATCAKQVDFAKLLACFVLTLNLELSSEAQSLRRESD